MPDINISRAFTVTLQDGTRIPLVPGLNHVSEEVANHPVIQYIRVPEDAPQIDMGDPMLQPDANGIGQLVQARAAAEDAAARLRTEVQRLTIAWSEAEIRARRAEGLLEDAQSQLAAMNVNDTVSQATYDDAVAQRDAANQRVAELEGSVGDATGKVQGLAQEFKAQPSPVPASAPIETPSSPPVEAAPVEDTSTDGEPDEVVGDYTVRRRGKKFTVVKLDADGNTLETVGTYDSKPEAEAEAESLKAAL
jgi:hypothetical protein